MRHQVHVRWEPQMEEYEEALTEESNDGCC